MAKFESPLNNIKIASPCSVNWDEMYGNERKRFCGDCKLNVYNLSEMTRDEAENVIMGTEGRLCVKFYKRADGSILTQDCPVGWAKVKQRAQVVATAAFSLILSLFGGLLFASFFSKGQKDIGKFRWIPLTTPSPNYERTMGMIAMPSPTPKQTPTPKATPRGEKTTGIMVPPRKESEKPVVNINEPIVN
jgi:hypothetical protein